MDTTSNSDEQLNKGSGHGMCVCYDPDDLPYDRMDVPTLKEIATGRINKMSEDKLIALLKFLDTQ